MINITSKIGACGFVPLINYIKPILPIAVIKIDDNMNPIRDKKTGFCIECKRGEKGLLIGRYIYFYFKLNIILKIKSFCY